MFPHATGRRTDVNPYPAIWATSSVVSGFHPLLQVPGTSVPSGLVLSMPVTLYPVSWTTAPDESSIRVPLVRR